MSRRLSFDVRRGRVTALLVVAAWTVPGGVAGGEAPSEPLTSLRARVTRGAAPGYIDDRTCGLCHQELYRSYQEVGMARSFYRPRADRLVEDFGAGPFLHRPSRRTYAMTWHDGRLTFRRHQLDDDGRPINVFEQEVDWILGSGSRARTYLYRTAAGELYQLPVAWYGQTGTWGMAPGYDRPDHQGVVRRVRRECIFCHNAYPEVPAGSDADGWTPQTYPADLPAGVGCQRCHGPGGDHVWAATREGDEFDFAALRSTIFNQGRLPPEKRDEVCQGCHFQPSVAIPGLRRLGRADYSYRPDEPLSDYLVLIDVDDGQPRARRFEINHHPYRLRQSRCFTASPRGLSCLLCHDPHRKVPAGQRPAHYREACLSCHQLDACRLDPMRAPAADPLDCVSCHMPRRRTQDVVQATVTDHLIRRRPGGPELLAPLSEHDPTLEDVRMLTDRGAPDGPWGQLYRALAVVRAGGGNHGPAVAALEHRLAELRPPQLTPYLDLALGQLRQRRIAAFEETVADILDREPDQPLALEWKALVLSGLGHRDEAIDLLRRTAGLNPERAETLFNLGVLLTDAGRAAEAVPVLERALEIRPNQVAAWFHLGEACSRLGRREEAIGHYRRALEIDPTHGRAYLALGRALLRTNQRAEAVRVWRHGRRHAARPEGIAAELDRLGTAAETAQPPP